MMAKKDRALNGYEEEGWGWYLPDGPEVQGLRARIAELEAMVVWAVQHGAELEGDRVWWFRLLSEHSGPVDIDCDGTPASILAAVQQAMKAGAKEGE